MFFLQLVSACLLRVGWPDALVMLSKALKPLLIGPSHKFPSTSRLWSEVAAQHALMCGTVGSVSGAAVAPDLQPLVFPQRAVGYVSLESFGLSFEQAPREKFVSTESISLWLCLIGRTRMIFHARFLFVPYYMLVFLLLIASPLFCFQWKSQWDNRCYRS